MKTTTAILVLVLVALVGVFALALAGVLPGEQAMNFAGNAVAAFLGAVVGKATSLPTGGISLSPPALDSVNK